MVKGTAWDIEYGRDPGAKFPLFPESAVIIDCHISDIMTMAHQHTFTGIGAQ
jgi:hypothetical protein